MFEEKLRDSLRQAVEGVQAGDPPIRRAMARGRLRKWIRLAELVFTALLAVGTLTWALVGLSVLGDHPSEGPVRRAAAGNSFPGDGRILVSDTEGLKWVYADGRIVTVAKGFLGAAPFQSGGRLLAWKPTDVPGTAAATCSGCFYDVDYYVMGLDGSDRQLVLPAEAPAGTVYPHHLDVQVSPGGSKIAYVRQEDLVDGGVRGDELWWTDLATGQKTDLGAVPSSDAAFVWKDGSTLLAQSPDERELDWIDVQTGTRQPYLGVSDPAITDLFQRLRPGIDGPTSLAPLGWSTDPSASALAVLVSGADRASVLVFFGTGEPEGFAPDARHDISLQWGPTGVFALTSFGGDRPEAGAGLYVGNAEMVSPTGQLPTLPQVAGVQGVPEQVAFDPSGSVVVYQFANGDLTFTPVPAAACPQSVTCRSFSPVTLHLIVLHLLAWLP
ncbi:MAG: hypothetical protein HY240_07655 [Actinobacteria bacterium]|nr:hypothetical protein [Actinomycetota bacterium]